MRILVTGGAKRLGAAIARWLAGDEHAVVIHYGGSAGEAEALAVEIGAAGTVQGDLARVDAIGDLWARAVEVAGGPIDGLVNSASLFEYDAATSVDAALAARIYAVNCTAPVLLTQALAAGGGGAVVNILDQKLANPNPDFLSYTLSKAALAEATVLLAQAHAPGTRVNAVAPGLTLPSGDQTADQFARVASVNLLGRPVGAEMVADAVAWLLGAESVTGQTVFVDCGQRFVRSARDVMFND